MASHDLTALRIQRQEEQKYKGGRGRSLFRWILFPAILVLLGVAAWWLDLIPRSLPEVSVAKPRLLAASGAEEILTATGYMVPQLRSVVSARTSGRLDWLGVDEGSVVKAGQIIARLSSDDLSAQVAEGRASRAQAQATLAQSRATLWEAEREQTRQERLLADGITTQAASDSSRRARDVAIAGVTASEEMVRAAQARLDLNLANQEKTLVRAPFAGTVIAKTAEIGEMVAAGAFSGQPTGGAIVTVADFSTIEMEADVNESNLSRIAVGQPALIMVDAVPDRRYRGVLRLIVPAADRQRAVVCAKVRLLDADSRIVPDLSARISFLNKEVTAEAASARAKILIPSAAIRTEAGGTFVLAVREERLVRLPITLGESRGDLREVTAGLQGDETLVLTGDKGAAPGTKVRIAS